MTKRNKTGLCLLALSGVMQAAGGKPGTPTVNPPNTAEIRISSETVPAGGTVQIKFSLTNPQPILSGGGGFAFDLNGAALTSPLGDAAGVAVYANGMLTVNALSPLGDLGTGDYPFLTLTTHVAAGTKTGTVFPLDFASLSPMVTAAGPLSVTVKPGTLTVGGAFSIDNVIPGGGTYPAGTTVRVIGTGFTSGAQLRTPQIKFSSYRWISPTEIDFVLKEATTLDSQAVQVTIGALTQTYYSYLRGTPVRPPSRDLLKTTDPIFQQLTHALAQAGPFDTQASGQYVAIALQNPNPGPAAVTLTLTHGDGTVSGNLVVLPSGGRLVDDVAALLNVSSLRTGDVFNLVSTAHIQILGLKMDEKTGSATPFLPAF